MGIPQLTMTAVNVVNGKESEQKEEEGVYMCSEKATSFVEGDLNIEYTGNKFVLCPKILVDTGALVPSGIAVSEDFFVSHLGGGY